VKLVKSRVEINTILKHLQDALTEFIGFCQKDLDHQTMVYEFWNAKNILGHITF